MSDNLSKKQFPKEVYASDEEHPSHLTPLKSPWIPNLSGHSLKWHLLDHHTRSNYTEVDPKWGPQWKKGSIVPPGMNSEEYHQKLHDENSFEWGKEHKHFTPKGKK